MKCRVIPRSTEKELRVLEPSRTCYLLDWKRALDSLDFKALATHNPKTDFILWLRQHKPDGRGGPTLGNVKRSLRRE